MLAFLTSADVYYIKRTSYLFLLMHSSLAQIVAPKSIKREYTSLFGVEIRHHFLFFSYIKFLVNSIQSTAMFKSV